MRTRYHTRGPEDGIEGAKRMTASQLYKRAPIDCSLYALDPSDDDHMHMIEMLLGETCDCGNQIFSRNKCTSCGAQAPWASQLGCGLA